MSYSHLNQVTARQSKNSLISSFLSIRLARNTKLLNFARQGNPGAKFKSTFEKAIKALTISKTVKEELGIQDEAVGD